MTPPTCSTPGCTNWLLSKISQEKKVCLSCQRGEWMMPWVPGETVSSQEERLIAEREPGGRDGWGRKTYRF
jgi:hypothetical protein